MKAGHLTFVGSDWIEALLATGKTIRDTMGCLIAATTDGSRVFLHVWAENGHWVWVLHRVRFR